MKPGEKNYIDNAVLESHEKFEWNDKKVEEFYLWIKDQIRLRTDVYGMSVDQSIILFKRKDEKTYTASQMKECFWESRLTNPMIGFKHDTFEDYLKTIK